jgi:hypothetical protein
MKWKSRELVRAFSRFAKKIRMGRGGISRAISGERERLNVSSYRSEMGHAIGCSILSKMMEREEMV